MVSVPLFVMLWHTAPTPLIFGIFGAVAGMVTSVVLVGITPQPQLLAVNQLLLVTPIHEPTEVVVRTELAEVTLPQVLVITTE